MPVAKNFIYLYIIYNQTKRMLPHVYLNITCVDVSDGLARDLFGVEVDTQQVE